VLSDFAPISAQGLISSGTSSVEIWRYYLWICDNCIEIQIEYDCCLAYNTAITFRT
jgi:hypothetical protein